MNPLIEIFWGTIILFSTIGIIGFFGMIWYCLKEIAKPVETFTMPKGTYVIRTPLYFNCEMNELSEELKNALK